MPVYLLNDDLFFPDPNDPGQDGLLAVGGDLRPERLLLAYEMGVFPWYNPQDPILWWSPDPRCLLQINELKISKSMRNVLNQKKFFCTLDTAFDDVLHQCRFAKRKEDGTWITDEMAKAYGELHRLGVAHSVEVWQDDKLVGGLYGLSLGNMFFGESMFSLASNASKVALIKLAELLKKKDFEWIDCQIYNDHLGSLGAKEVPRKTFLNLLEESMKRESHIGSWSDWI